MFKFKSVLDNFVNFNIGVNFPQTAHPDSTNCSGVVSLQKLEIIVCCNFSEGEVGGNNVDCFFWLFFTAIRCDIL
jgi:hypothetical protein